MLASLDLVEFDDPALSARAAGVESRLNFPIFSGFGQFSLYILALQKQCFRAIPDERLRKAD